MTTLSEDLASVVKAIEHGESNAAKWDSRYSIMEISDVLVDAKEAAYDFLRTHGQEIAGLGAENERLKAELAACRRDAESLRNLVLTWWEDAQYHCDGDRNRYDDTPDFVQAAIDAQGRGEG